MRFHLRLIVKHDGDSCEMEGVVLDVHRFRLYHGYGPAHALPAIPKFITTNSSSHHSRSIISLWSDVSRVPEFLLQLVIPATSYSERPLLTQSIPSGLNQSTLVAQSSNLSSTSSGKKVGAGSRFER